MRVEPAALVARLRKAQAQHRFASSEWNRWQDVITTVGELLAREGEQIDTLRAQIANIESEISELESENEKLESELEAVRARLAKRVTDDKAQAVAARQCEPDKDV